MGTCDISVIMSVYNTKAQWLREAIESILNQTYSGFEFIIVLDCPTDGCDAVVWEYASKDERIKVLPNETNLGLTCSLNKALAQASGRYIARMDADDVAMPDRFEKQIAYMEENPDVVVLGGRVYTEGSNATAQYEWSPDQDVLKIRMLFRNVGVPHPTAMIRKSVLDEQGIAYTEAVKKSQDYKLWTDLMHHGKIMILPDVVLMYRMHEGQISAGKASQMGYAQAIAKEQAEKLLGELNETELTLHLSMTGPELPGDNLVELDQYLKRIRHINSCKQVYDSKKLARELDYMWCQKAVRRAAIEKKFDMLFNWRMFRLLRNGTFGCFMESRRRKQEYLCAVQQANRAHEGRN